MAPIGSTATNRNEEWYKVLSDIGKYNGIFWKINSIQENAFHYLACNENKLIKMFDCLSVLCIAVRVLLFIAIIKYLKLQIIIFIKIKCQSE